MPIFGVDQSMSSNLPINQVKTMRAQGIDNNQIIQSLQREGFTISNIFDAMNQADMPGPNQNQSSTLSATAGPQGQGPSAPPQPQSPESMQSQSFPSQSSHAPVRSKREIMMDSDDPISTEELVEAIIDEKWSELSDNITKVIDWKNQTNEKILLLEQKYEDLHKEFDKVHKALIGKLEKYDESIGGVNANVSAMEKTFGKMLPLFSENISELSKVVSELKTKSSKK